MNLSFKPFSCDEEAILNNWINSESWPFHAPREPNDESHQKTQEGNYYFNDDRQTFWIIMDDKKRVGLIILTDLRDDTPVFDIRVSSKFRGKGIGTQGVNWLTEYIFTNWPKKIRIEAYTRHDNVAMRSVFRKCGYVKEAHHRKAWPDENKKYYDSIGYGVIREDWEKKKITPVNWDDE